MTQIITLRGHIATGSDVTELRSDEAVRVDGELASLSLSGMYDHDPAYWDHKVGFGPLPLQLDWRGKHLAVCGLQVGEAVVHLPKEAIDLPDFNCVSLKLWVKAGAKVTLRVRPTSPTLRIGEVVFHAAFWPVDPYLVEALKARRREARSGDTGPRKG